MNDKASDPGQRPSVVIERTYRATAEELWNLWTTKDGFESWWGPQGFRVNVHRLEARLGGALHYDMIAATPEMIAAMQEMGQPPSHSSRATFSVFEPCQRLELTHVVDFIPGVPTYDSIIQVAFVTSEDRVRMIVTLGPMHDEEFSQMQLAGFTSQLTKLDQRFHLVQE